MTMQKENPTKQKTERATVRWMLLFYDTLLYVLCWWAVFVIQPSMGTKIPLGDAGIFFVVGYVLFFLCRMLFKAYRQIWRYGAISAFSKELKATIFGSVLYVLACLLLEEQEIVPRVPFTSLIVFVMAYMILSVGVRVLYYHMFLYAKSKRPLAKTLRAAIEMFARVDFDSKTPGATLPLVSDHKKETAPINELQRIIDQFAIHGNVTKITQINKGYINRTYYIETLSERGHVHKYTLQRINTNVFPDVDALMENFRLTTDHLYGKLRLPGQHARGSVHSLRCTKDGHPYLRDDTGCWRMVTFFDGVYSLDIPDSPETFYHAGLAFGSFVKEMSDVDISKVKEVIPNFHNTLSRYQDLEKAIARDAKGRVSQVMAEIAFVRARVDRYGMISSALEKGEIPTRICHNDCNLNNLLFDEKTNLPVAIIDLDTVMPSSPLYDFGDSIRIGANTAKDDEKDLSKVSCDLTLYEQYARGYLEACGDMLTKKELELLPYAALIITSEDGIRFLMDHIDGDTYYNIYYPGQNLDRSRTQLRLVEDMETKLPEIKRILKRIYKDLGLKA
ncbi:MAG: hypothetical protein E7470_08605 [Ruminococcaceae bacterium]|nr:hypothetical protein [Oscillospiraceae bacterium]